MLVTAADKETADARGWIERSFGFLIGHQLDGSHQADATHFPHQRMRREASKSALHPRRHVPDVRKDIFLFVDLQSFQRYRGRNRVPTVSKTMTEDAGFRGP